MKVIIAGSRDIEDLKAVMDAVKASGFPAFTEVVSGCAAGVDRVGEYYAQLYSIPVKQFPADWKRHKRGAGPIRNKQMAEYADALIAVWDGKSKGTKNMIDQATKKGLKVYVHIWDENAN